MTGLVAPKTARRALLGAALAGAMLATGGCSQIRHILGFDKPADPVQAVYQDGGLVVGVLENIDRYVTLPACSDVQAVPCHQPAAKLKLQATAHEITIAYAAVETAVRAGGDGAKERGTLAAILAGARTDIAVAAPWTNARGVSPPAKVLPTPPARP